MQGNQGDGDGQLENIGEDDDYQDGGDYQEGGDGGPVFSDKGDTGDGDTSPLDGNINLLNDDMLDMQDMGSDGIGTFDDINPQNQ